MMVYFFFNDTATTEIYTLSLHDALPISPGRPQRGAPGPCQCATRLHADGEPGLHAAFRDQLEGPGQQRSEEHTSELQSRQYLVCRLLLEKKKKHNEQQLSPRIQRLITQS